MTEKTIMILAIIELEVMFIHQQSIKKKNQKFLQL